MIMQIFFREIIALLPIIVLCITTFFVLLCILIYRNDCITFFITIFGISISFFSLYLVWKNGVQRISDLICIDGFSLLCMLLVLITSFFISIISRIWLSHYCFSDDCDEFYLLLLIFNIGAIIVINASHIITLFFGIELISLPLFGLLGYFNLHKYSLEATIKYVLLSGISTAFLLFGIALVYVETKHLSFSDIYLELVEKPSLEQSKVLMGGIIMMLFGFGFKLSLVPFHLWTADVYQGSSEIASMCLATISKISIFSVLTRFFLLFPESYSKVRYILVLISCLSILFGSIMAIKQNNIKRILAYSSVAHMGYLLVGVVASMKEFSKGSSCYILNLLTDGIETIGFSLVNYLFSTLGIFVVLCLSCCYYHKDYEKKENIGMLFLYRGLFWKDPVLSVIFTIILLSLAGIPMTLGFISKFYLVILSVKNDLSFCTVSIIFGTVISMLYYLPIITNLYLSPLSKTFNLGIRCGVNYASISGIAIRYRYYCNRYFLRSSNVLVLIIALFLLFLGVYPQFLVRVFFLIQKNF